jgi:hypothetical protein
MSVRSGTKAFRLLLSVFSFGRSSLAALVTCPNTLLSVSPLTVRSSEQIKLCDQKALVGCTGGFAYGAR